MTKQGLGFVYDRTNDKVFLVHEYGLIDITRLCESIELADDPDNYNPGFTCGLDLRVIAMDSGGDNEE